MHGGQRRLTARLSSLFPISKSTFVSRLDVGKWFSTYIGNLCANKVRFGSDLCDLIDRLNSRWGDRAATRLDLKLSSARSGMWTPGVAQSEFRHCDSFHLLLRCQSQTYDRNSAGLQTYDEETGEDGGKMITLLTRIWF